MIDSATENKKTLKKSAWVMMSSLDFLVSKKNQTEFTMSNIDAIEAMLGETWIAAK